jgi:hypothetical protein
LTDLWRSPSGRRGCVFLPPLWLQSCLSKQWLCILAAAAVAKSKLPSDRGYAFLHRVGCNAAFKHRGRGFLPPHLLQSRLSTTVAYSCHFFGCRACFRHRDCVFYNLFGCKVVFRQMLCILDTALVATCKLLLKALLWCHASCWKAL